MTTNITIYCDGGAHNNQDAQLRSAYGSFKVYCNGKLVDTIDYQGRMHRGGYRAEFGNKTNNEAEYEIFIAALGYLYELNLRLRGDQDVTYTIHSDSALMLNQVDGTWKIKELNLRDLCMYARNLIAHIGHPITLVQVPRAEIVKRLGH